MRTLYETFVGWLTTSSDKAEKIEFKTQREAAEFVRRVYNQNAQPNAHLTAVYQRGSALKAKSETKHRHLTAA